MRNWRGEKGLLDVFSFRSDSRGYLNTKQLTEEAFVLDILQALCDDAVSLTTRLHLLGVLQEYPSVLLTTPASVEHATASLQDVFRHSKPGGATVYKGQLLVTVTTILVTSDCVNTHSALVREFVEVLLDTASQVTTSSLGQLRAVTCQCLVELEVCYPGILSRKLEYIYQWCHLETTAVHQSYIALFVTVLKNVICQLSLNPDSASEQSLTQMLCDRREPLKPFIYPKKLLSLDSSGSGAPLPPQVDITAFERVVEYVLKFIDLATPSTGVYVMRQLASAVNLTQLSPSVFRQFMLRHVTSLNIAILHATTELQNTFGDAVVPPNDNKLHPQIQATICMRHPSLTSNHSLLVLQWLPRWPFPELELPQVCDNLRPRPVDSLTLQVQRLTQLSLVLASSPMATEQCCHLLMECVSPLLSQVRQGTCGTTAAALYRVLLAYYTMHQDNVELQAAIERATVDLQKTYAALSWHTLDFLQQLQQLQLQQLQVQQLQQQQLQSGQDIVVQVLSALVTEILGMVHQMALQDLSHQLRIVEMAACQSQIDPGVILQLLSRVLQCSSDVCRHGDWTFGMTVLRVLRCLLQHHDTQGHVQSLGEVLHCMMTEYADVDVRERARFYYLLVCSLAPKKVSEILSRPAAVQRDDNTRHLANIVSEGGYLPSVRAVTVLPQPLLKLSMCAQITEDRKMEGGQQLHLEDTDKELLDNYFEFLNSNTSLQKKEIYFNITFTDQLPDIEAVYSLVLQFRPQSGYAPVQDVQISYLSRDVTAGKTESRLIPVELHLEETAPTELQVAATFLGGDGRTYQCLLDPVSVNLSHLMCPMPYPADWSVTALQPLFDQLWTMMTNSLSQRRVDGLETVLCVTVLPSILRTILDSTLHQFIITEDAGGSTCLAAFLPPSSHLLLKVKVDQDGTTVRFTMATDNWRILPLMSDYLRAITGVEE